MSRITTPAGAIIFRHEECDLTERVPYADHDELVKAFDEALVGGMSILDVTPYLNPADPGSDAAYQRLLSVMDERGTGRYSVYQLTPDNLNTVLGDFTVTIPARP